MANPKRRIRTDFISQLLMKKKWWLSSPHINGKVRMGCPYHDDNVTSLEIDLIDETFECKSCGASGYLLEASFTIKKDPPRDKAKRVKVKVIPENLNLF